MAIPVNATLTVVTETYIFQDGTTTGIPASGNVTFTPTHSIYVNDAGNAIFPPSTVTATLDASGTFSVQLISADDTDLTPNAWTYDVVENLSVGSKALPARTYSIEVPLTGPVRLSSIAPAPPSGGSVAGFVLQVNGKNPDGSGHVTLVPSDIGAYAKPGSGIPSTDMTTAVQTSLGKADTAVQSTRTLTAGTGLTGLGDLSADRTVAVDFGTVAGKVAQGNDNRIANAEQTTNKNAAGGYAGTDATSRVAPANAPLTRQTQTLTFASTVTIDATTGSDFGITLTGNLTLANPTGLLNGQLVQVILTQDGTGGRTLTLGSIFNNAGLTLTLSTAANKRDRLVCQYHGPSSKLDILAFQAGY